MQVTQHYPDLGRRLLRTFRGYLEAEKRNNPGMADSKDWQRIYDHVCERERKAAEVRPDSGVSTLALPPPVHPSCLGSLQASAPQTAGGRGPPTSNHCLSLGACLCSLGRLGASPPTPFPPPHKVCTLKAGIRSGLGFWQRPAPCQLTGKVWAGEVCTLLPLHED